MLKKKFIFKNVKKNFEILKIKKKFFKKVLEGMENGLLHVMMSVFGNGAIFSELH
jgi:hypothetical protein